MKTPTNKVFLVEFQTLLNRKSSKSLVLMALLSGVIAPLIMFKLQDLIDSRHVDAVIGENVAVSMMRALAIYNVFIVPLMIPIIAAKSLAGEWRKRQLHLTLTAPISRWSLITAKTMAVSALNGIAMLIMCIPILLISTSRYSSFGPIGDALVAYGLSILAHTAIVGIAFLISTRTQKVWLCACLTMASLFVFFCLHFIFNLPVLFLPESMKEIGPRIAEWLPWDSLHAWAGWKKGFGLAPTRLSAGLLILFAILRIEFNRADLGHEKGQ